VTAAAATRARQWRRRRGCGREHVVGQHGTDTRARTLPSAVVAVAVARRHDAAYLALGLAHVAQRHHRIDVETAHEIGVARTGAEFIVTRWRRLRRRRVDARVVVVVVVLEIARRRRRRNEVVHVRREQRTRRRRGRRRAAFQCRFRRRAH
jgi:hypothetical protein